MRWKHIVKAEFVQMNNSSFNKKFSLIALNMNTVYKVGKYKKYADNYFVYVWGKFGYGPNLPQLKWPN